MAKSKIVLQMAPKWGNPSGSYTYLARAGGRVGSGAFHSATGVGNLIALIKKLSGVSVWLEDRKRLPQR